MKKGRSSEKESPNVPLMEKNKNNKRERERSGERSESNGDARLAASPLLHLLLHVLPPRRIKCLNFICGTTLTGREWNYISVEKSGCRSGSTETDRAGHD